jgi:two-component system OmpR family sensor kinase
MSEQLDSIVQKRWAAQPLSTEREHSSSSGGLYLLDSSSSPCKEPDMASLNRSSQPQPQQNVPSWLRPFFSLKVQLTSAFSLLLILVVIFSYLLFNQDTSPLLTALYMVILVGLGTAFTYGITSYLLHPLARVTDAAQAIAIGDLAQRNRLNVRLPPQDEVDRIAGSLHEMVKRLERAEELQAASQEQFRQFFSDASHQLRTPLTSLRGFTELLMRGVRDNPEAAQRILKLMHNEAVRMTLLINDLLTMTRLNDNHPLKLQYLDLAEMAFEGINQARSRADEGHHISLNIATNKRLGIQADRERIKQLIFILLDNALKYGKPAPQGRITLRLDKHQKQVEISVIDNGEGIASEDLEHIFDAFYRGRHRSSPNTQIIGTGLGLTIASAIVRSHNGTIHVCSEPGNTEFKVLLPCID